MRYKLSADGVDLKMIYGFKMALFGVLIGTVDYMGSNATKGTMESVLKSMGFLTHTSTSTAESELVNLVSVVSSVTTTTTLISDDVDSNLDYEKLLYMQDNWFNFFAIQRWVQLVAPYLFLFSIEAAIGGILALAILFID